MNNKIDHINILVPLIPTLLDKPIQITKHQEGCKDHTSSFAIQSQIFLGTSPELYIINQNDYNKLKELELFEYLKTFKVGDIISYVQARFYLPKFYKRVMNWFKNINNSILKSEILIEIEKLTYKLIKNDQTIYHFRSLAEILLTLCNYQESSQYLKQTTLNSSYKFICCVLPDKYDGSPIHSIKPLPRNGSKQTIEFNDSTIFVHQTPLDKAIQILLKKKIIATEQKCRGYLGNLVYFGIEHSVDSYQPSLFPIEKNSVLENRYGSVSFKFISNFKYNFCFNLGERKFKNEYSHLFLFSNQEFKYLMCMQYKDLIKHELEKTKAKWELIVSNKEFTNAEVCVEDSFDLPTEFTVQIVDHGNGALCVKHRMVKGSCSDCNQPKEKEDIKDIIKNHVDIKKMFTISDLGNNHLKFSLNLKIN